MTSTPALRMKEIGRGVAEVYSDDYQVGMITWNPNPHSGIVSTWYATYANSDETVTMYSRDDALQCLRLQHAAVQRYARSLRSIRPASVAGDAPQKFFDSGYNNALRDVEHITREIVGQAPKGEGYTAITDTE